ncbi:unnamed protein product [Prunus brigantina]
MHPADREHTAFITDRGLYCYNVMPFGLKNAGATYQRLVNQIFADLIGTSMEVYVDDMLVKSRTANDHLRNLSLMFDKLKQYNMRLNPSKCAFGVASGKFLGFMFSQRGIEANPEKIRALIDMRVPKTKKEVQSLTGRVAALARFISRATDRCAPFFKALKGSKRQIDWPSECDRAFEDLKHYMSRAPPLSTPLPGETLIIYLSVSASALSSVLIRRTNGIELPIFYMSHALQDTEQRYPQLEQLAYALGRLIKWAIELGEFDISYQPRPSEKGQAVADFISEFTIPAEAVPSTATADPPLPSADPSTVATDSSSAEVAFDRNSPHWTLYVDGSSNRQGSGAGLVLKTPDHTTIEYAIRFQFRASNNEAEYEALLAGLRLAQHTGAERLLICSDSQLVVNQQIPRSENSHVDALSRLASAIDDRIGRHVPVEVLARRSTTEAEMNTVGQDPSWMDPIHAYLTSGTLPTDRTEARTVRRGSARYLLLQGILYRRSHSLPLLRSVAPQQGDYILREIHEGACGDHSGSRSLAFKAVRQGYYWPSLHADATRIVQKCDPCQRFGSVPKVPAEPLSPMTSPWPFAQWGLDLIGPMPPGTGQVKFAVVAVDYFTKWTEAEALATITAAKIEHFVWKNILCRFGLPNAIVTDNGKQFDCSRFRNLCSRFNISIFFASPAHPQSNGQVEAINKIIKKTLKKKLGAAKGNWPEILPEAIWAINTSYRRSTGETPFSLAFGTEAVVPVELRNATYKQRTARYYDSRVKHRSFKVGDWVLRKESLATRTPTEGTLGPSWEGPYQVVSIGRRGAYRLRDSDGQTLGHPWNVEQLKVYYK